MLEKQKILMDKTKESLEYLLYANEYMLYPDAGEFEIYKSYLSELALEFPNQETLALGLELMDMIYRAKNKTGIYWIDTIEKVTVISLMFTDFSSDTEK